LIVVQNIVKVADDMSSSISFAPKHENPSASYHLIFFISGNPGLISYYDTFLRTLHQLLSENGSDEDVFHIYGESLAGFGDNDTPSNATGLPYSLEEQVETRIQCLESRRIPSGVRRDQAYDSIILIGHSVGTFIILEMLKRLKKSPRLNIKAGILLFPTVTHIAESPRGIKLAGILRIPGLAKAVGLLANTLTWLAPRSAVRLFVRLVTGMSDEAIEVTTRFLTSRMGVWQALLVLLFLYASKY
jgi:pimeloyl-ACP methyl ester carboxylesterase